MMVIPSGMDTYVIAFGSNMGDSVKILEGALERMGEDSRLSFVKISSFYRTKPWGITEQRDFINGAALVKWKGSPEDLMTFLLRVEKEFGRKREVHWGPRTLDLDMIYSEKHRRDTDFLHLPHPYFWERSFVLVPMEEIWPDFSYEGMTIHERLAHIQGYDGIEKIGREKEMECDGE